MGLEDLDRSWDDTKEAENKSYDPVPDGKYNVFLFTSEVKTPKNQPDGMPYLAAQFRVLNGSLKGRTIFKNFSFTAEALPYSKKELNLMGWTGKPSALLDPVSSAERAKLLDRSVEVNVKNSKEVYNGKERNNQRVFVNRSLGLATRDQIQASGSDTPSTPEARQAAAAPKSGAGAADDEPPF
jgi:hypothetical protein